MTNKDFIYEMVFILLIMLVTAFISSVVVLELYKNDNIGYKVDRLYEKEYRCEMYSELKHRYDNKTVANGIYWNSKNFYCVFAKNRTLEEQDKTDRHEYAHYLIDNDYEHFCLGVNEQ